MRERLGADILRVSHELSNERQAREAAEQALRRADDERQRAVEALVQERAAARSVAIDLTGQLADAQKVAGAAEVHAR